MRDSQNLILKKIASRSVACMRHFLRLGQSIGRNTATQDEE